MEGMKKMKESVNVKIIYHFYHHVVKAELKRRGFSKDVARKIGEEHHKIIQRAKDIGFIYYGKLFYRNESKYREICRRKL